MSQCAWRSETSIIAFQILFAIVFFYPTKSSMVIAYLLYAVLFKDIVNSTLVFAIFLQFLGRRLMLFLFSLELFFIGISYLHSCQTSGIASVYYS